jgi:molybdopterin converting factor small subunit
MTEACLKIDVQLFAAAADLAGSRRLQVLLPIGATLLDLRRAVAVQCPPLNVLAENSRWAVGTEFVPDSFAFSVSLSVAMIPPVSGG